ncbi:hypothetical protein ACEF06_25500, partial [Brevibacillus agri]
FGCVAENVIQNTSTNYERIFYATLVKKFTYQKDDTAKLRWKLVEQEAADGEPVKVAAPQSFDAFVQEKASN